MHPAGTFLVVQHEDRPGVIAAVSTLLASNDINIARIELGRDRPRGQAVMLMEIDDPVDSAMLERLAAVAKLEQLRQVRL
jgi:D-3-phosphoglycerate dehydrogenase / 2-oxoglutarate reductase